MLTRRNMLCGLAGSLVSIPSSSFAMNPSRPGTRIDSLVSLIDPFLDIHNVHTGESLSLRYFQFGRYDLDAVKRINWLMRDHRQNQAAQMDARLLWTLSAIRMAAMQDGHSGRIMLLSGFRTQATNQLLRSRGIQAALNSFHLRAQAADITLQGVSIAHLANYARWLEVGGVGHYRRSNFVHIDSGHERSWGS